MAPPITLDELQRIKRWHVEHRSDHPVEYQFWDLVLTLWVMAWVGWLPAFAFDAEWAYLLCGLGQITPDLYVRGRARAHGAKRLRCDWLQEHT